MDSVSHPIDVNPGPIASFTFDTVCEADTTHFTNQSTTVPPLGGPIDNYNWDMGGIGQYVNTTSNTSPSPEFIYNNAGIYQVILTVTDINGCQGYDTNTIIVDTIPIAQFTATEVCDSFPTIFTNLSQNTSGTIVSWLWNMNGVGTYQLPNSNTSIDPIYTYDDYGSYLVSLTVTDDNGCSDTWDSTIVVRPIPTTIFTIVAVSYTHLTLPTIYSV